MDEEARAMVNESYERTLKLIRDHEEDVEKVANLLLEKETITHDDITELIGPRPFAGDKQYQEYISSSKEAQEEAGKETEAESEKKEDTDSDGGLTPTPGLA
jgi:AFG3 family protein